MIYNNGSHIKSVKDVKAFFQHIVFERKSNFHPDDMFEDYVSFEGSFNIFTLEECAIYNHLLDKSFNVYKKEEVNIFSVGLDELQTALGINVA